LNLIFGEFFREFLDLEVKKASQAGSE